MTDDTPITVHYYTDPLCIWSWGYEPVRRRILYEFRNVLFRPVAGGLMLTNRAASPAGSDQDEGPNQKAMKQHWMEVSRKTQMPADWDILDDIRLQSTRPLASAIAAAAAQHWRSASHLLRLIREALFIDQRNVFDPAVVEDLASQVDTLDFDEWQKAQADGTASQLAGEGFAEVRDPAPEAVDLVREPDGPRYAYPTLLWRDAQATYTAQFDTPFEQVSEALQTMGAVRRNHPGKSLADRVQQVFDQFGRLALVELATILDAPADELLEAADKLPNPPQQRDIHGQLWLEPAP